MMYHVRIPEEMQLTAQGPSSPIVQYGDSFSVSLTPIVTIVAVSEDLLHDYLGYNSHIAAALEQILGMHRGLVLSKVDNRLVLNSGVHPILQQAIEIAADRVQEVALEMSNYVDWGVVEIVADRDLMRREIALNIVLEPIVKQGLSRGGLLRFQDYVNNSDEYYTYINDHGNRIRGRHNPAMDTYREPPRTAERAAANTHILNEVFNSVDTPNNDIVTAEPIEITEVATHNSRTIVQASNEQQRTIKRRNRDAVK